MSLNTGSVIDGGTDVDENLLKLIAAGLNSKVVPITKTIVTPTPTPMPKVVVNTNTDLYKKYFELTLDQILAANIRQVPISVNLEAIKTDSKWLANSQGTNFARALWLSKILTHLEVPTWYNFLVPEFFGYRELPDQGDMPAFEADAFIYEGQAPEDIIAFKYSYNKVYYDSIIAEDNLSISSIQVTNPCTEAVVTPSRPFGTLWNLSTGSPHLYFGLPIVDLASASAAADMAPTVTSSYTGALVNKVGYILKAKGSQNPFVGRHNYFYEIQHYAELIWRPTKIRIAWSPNIPIYLDCFEAFGSPEVHKRISSNTAGIPLTGGYAEIELKYTDLSKDIFNPDFVVGKLGHFDIRSDVGIFKITQFDAFGRNPLDYSIVDDGLGYEAMPFSQEYTGRGTEAGFLDVLFYQPMGSDFGEPVELHYMIDPTDFPSSEIDLSWPIAPEAYVDEHIPYCYGITVKIPAYDALKPSRVVVGYYAISKLDPTKKSFPVYRIYNYNSVGISPTYTQLTLDNNELITDDKGEALYV